MTAHALDEVVAAMEEALAWPFFDAFASRAACATRTRGWPTRQADCQQRRKRRRMRRRPMNLDLRTAATGCRRSACGQRLAALRALGGKAFGGESDALDTRTLCMLRETLAAHDGLADFAFAMQGLGSGAITLDGTLCPEGGLPAPRGARRCDRCVRAVGARGPASDVAAMSTTARRDGDHWMIDGEKTWILERRHRRLLRRVRAPGRARCATPETRGRRSPSPPSSSMPTRLVCASPSA